VITLSKAALILSFSTGVAQAETNARASWYGGGERLGRYTASGERFRPSGLTAAHRTLPLGTRLVVSVNRRSVIVRVNDRGPAAYTGRSLDLSRGAASALGMIGTGITRVTWRIATKMPRW
jgi:rare lipoprotein A